MTAKSTLASITVIPGKGSATRNPGRGLGYRPGSSPWPGVSPNSLRTQLHHWRTQLHRPRTQVHRWCTQVHRWCSGQAQL